MLLLSFDFFRFDVLVVIDVKFGLLMYGKIVYMVMMLNIGDEFYYFGWNVCLLLLLLLIGYVFFECCFLIIFGLCLLCIYVIDMKLYLM